MGIRRLAAAGAVSGAVLLGAAAPVAAAPKPPQDQPENAPVGPPRIEASPSPFTPGENLNVKVTGCKTEPRVVTPNEIFAKNEPSSFNEEGDGVWTAIGGTRLELEGGHTYVSKFTCLTGKGLASFQLQTKLPSRPKPPTTPSPKPPAKPGFTFTHDDVELSTRRAVPGATLGLKVTCPVQPRARSASFVSAPRLEIIGKSTWEGAGRFKSHLPSIVRVTVECPGYGSVSFTSSPGEKDVTPGTPTIPVGYPDTGDGSTVRQNATRQDGGALLAGALAVLAGTGLVLRRRVTRERG